MIDDPLELATASDGLLLAEILGDETVHPVEKPIGVTSRSYRRATARRTFQNLLKVKAAEALVDRLPGPGETIHMVVAGDFRTWDLVPAMLSLKRPAPIAELYLATLSYNRDNLNALVDLLDDGKIGAATLITSVYDPTMKPVALFEYLMVNSTRRGTVVLDPFAGSGTTLLAAEKTGRTARCMELDPRYVDVIRRRWAEFVHGDGCDWTALTPQEN